MGRINLSYIDHGGERSGVSVRVPDLTSANFDAETTANDAIRDAIDGVTILTRTKDARLATEVTSAATLPASPNAQRETKWLVRATDQVNGRAVTFEIPGADLTLLVANTGAMDITAGAGLTLVNALEGQMKSIDGNDIVIQEIIHVGRST